MDYRLARILIMRSTILFRCASAGLTDFSNLWPQPRQTIEGWNAEAKDRLERRLCEMVCAGELDIGTAQEAIGKDWIAAYRKYYGAAD
jgi:hypothetical protein